MTSFRSCFSLITGFHCPKPLAGFQVVGRSPHLTPQSGPPRHLRPRKRSCVCGNGTHAHAASNTGRGGRIDIPSTLLHLSKLILNYLPTYVSKLIPKPPNLSELILCKLIRVYFNRNLTPGSGSTQTLTCKVTTCLK